MPFGGLLTAGLISGVGSLVNGFMGSSASSRAAGEQVQAEQNAIDFQNKIWSQQQRNQQPFLNAGSTSLGQLMAGLSSGSFGPGSLPGAPAFTAPTLAGAQSSPGYQFTAQQGSKGILEGAAAAGGAISGGALKSLDAFNSNLANSTYNDVYNRALSTYQAGLQGYGLNLTRQQQEYNQLFEPAALGEGATSNLNATGSQVAQSVGQLMGNIGNAQAAGTVGSADAWAGAIGGLGNTATSSVLLNGILNKPAAPGFVPQGPVNPAALGLGPG